MTGHNRTNSNRMHSAQASCCFFQNHCIRTASTLAELLCALSLMIVSQIIISIIII